MIFAIIYIVFGIITAGAIIYHTLREQDLLRVEDILISLICGVFLVVSYFMCHLWLGREASE